MLDKYKVGDIIVTFCEKQLKLIIQLVTINNILIIRYTYHFDGALLLYQRKQYLSAKYTVFSVKT